MNLTKNQQRAVAARGNVLVVAGAGTGKTRTLVERCLACLLSETPPASIDEILMVTFTEAAAAEMRQRIRERMEQESLRGRDVTRWQEQLALFETAHFGTLHGFCFRLVREHFYQLGLDPQLAVLSEQETRLLAEETLDTVLQGHYAGQDAIAQAVRRLIQTLARGWDRPICALVLRLHEYAQTLPDPAAWLEGQLALFAAPEPTTWRGWWLDAVSAFVIHWTGRLASLAKQNGVAAKCAASLSEVCVTSSPQALSAIFAQIASAQANYPRGKKASWVDPLKDFFSEAEFLSSLLSLPGARDPLAEDWSWVREQMSALLQLSREFTQNFAASKRELGVLDFHDLEQNALRLLWDPVDNQPTSIARLWQRKLRFIFVDEYQDINAAQDRIIQALAREGPHANRFLVGDVKQSIYRFRLANPRIFQAYAAQWSQSPAQVLPLVDNFRSREGLLAFVNSVFGALMSRELGGADYATEAALQFGAPDQRAALSIAANPAPAVDLHLLLKGIPDMPEGDEPPSESLVQIIELQEAEKEARMLALRLQQLHAQKTPIWDPQASQFRPVAWKDMAILLRAPARKAESYAKEFARLNVPLHVARGGFYESLEISDLLSLLQLLDNPLQDLPLLAVLHSPIVGLTVNELALVRLTALKAPFWTALTRWHQKAGASSRQGQQQTEKDSTTSGSAAAADRQTQEKVSRFLERFARWRRLARHASLSRCLETVLTETHYSDWVRTQARGEQRHANIQRLLELAQDFDRFQRQGLFRFIQFTEAQKAVESEPDVAAASGENVVRLMSIHQSKGLEFPVVAVADLGKTFNLADLHAQVILDEQFGLCPLVKPPHTGKRYPSLAHWLARRRQLRELLGEEVRLLYVAMTRARDRLILSGTITDRKFQNLWRQPREDGAEALLGARNYLDWLGAWFARNVAVTPDSRSGQTSLLRWFMHHPADLLAPNSSPGGSEPEDVCDIDFQSDAWRDIQQRLAWKYPFWSATQQPAKTSVSALRRQSAVNEDDESVLLARPAPRPRVRSPLPPAPASGMDAADVGSAHHQFLQLVSLEQAGNAAELAAQAQQLQAQSRLTPEQVAVLDFERLAHFWQSDLGQRIRARSQLVHRELPFTARFSAHELPGMLVPNETTNLEGEFILVQGVADLVVVAPDEVWLLDFKTDRIEPDELKARVRAYAPQLLLYSQALSRIYQRPVTQCWLYFFSLEQFVAVQPGLQDFAPKAMDAMTRPV